MVESGPLTGLTCAEAAAAVEAQAQAEGFGGRAEVFRLRDWLVSRQVGSSSHAGALPDGALGPRVLVSAKHSTLCCLSLPATLGHTHSHGALPRVRPAASSRGRASSSSAPCEFNNLFSTVSWLETAWLSFLAIYWSLSNYFRLHDRP